MSCGDSHQKAPHEKSAPACTLPIAIMTRVDLDHIQAGNRWTGASRTRTADYFHSGKSRNIGSTNARNFSRVDGIRVDGDIDVATICLQAVALRLEVLQQLIAQCAAPMDDAAVLAGEAEVFAADRLSLCSKANVAVPRQGIAGMFECLAKRRAAVPMTGRERSDVQVGVNVQDAWGLVGDEVAQVMSIGSFMTSAKNDGDRAASQDPCDHFRKHILTIFQVVRSADIAGVQQASRCKVDVGRAIAGGHSVKPMTNLAGRLRRPGPTVISTHPFILRKTHHHGSTGRQSIRITSPEFDNISQAGIVSPAEQVLPWMGWLQQCKPLGRV